MPVTVLTADQGQQATIVVEGEMDVVTAPRMTSAVIELVTAGQGPMRVDLSRVSYMDSGGLAEIVRAQRFATQHGGTLELVGVTGLVEKLLRETGIDQLVPVQRAASTG